jgi:hypothetical protein
LQARVLALHDLAALGHLLTCAATADALVTFIAALDAIAPAANEPADA